MVNDGICLPKLAKIAQNEGQISDLGFKITPKFF
jgi:hypothetical protein